MNTFPQNEQEMFWASTYTKEYIDNNSSFNTEIGIKGWSCMLTHAAPIDNILECGCNIGRNIMFLNHILPNAKKSVIEIAKPAFEFVRSHYELQYAFNGSIVDSQLPQSAFDLTFTMGVLIHIHPDQLLANMTKLFDYSRKYILIGEYFNRTPVMIEYHNQENLLFKQDFGKLFMNNFPVRLIDYGFLWSAIYEKGGFDDITWWLFEK